MFDVGIRLTKFPTASCLVVCPIYNKISTLLAKWIEIEKGWKINIDSVASSKRSNEISFRNCISLNQQSAFQGQNAFIFSDFEKASYYPLSNVRSGVSKIKISKLLQSIVLRRLSIYVWHSLFPFCMNEYLARVEVFSKARFSIIHS